MSEESGDSVVRVGAIPADRCASTQLAVTLADLRAEDTTELRLRDHVDPEALDALFAPRHDGRTRGGGRVSFDTCGYRVVLRSSGLYTVEPADG